MKIGIIGAGEMGGTLVKQYTRRGHEVKVANASDIEKLRQLAQETGASAEALDDVVKDVDLLVISIPLIAVPTLSKLFKHASAHTIIVDTCNYYPIRDGIIPALEDGMPESIWVSDQLQRPVVKAYNSILYRSLLNSQVTDGNGSRIALPVSGDDKDATEKVCAFINENGFDALDVGTLHDSWRQQPGSPVYCTDLTLPDLKKSIAKAKKELLPARRELGLSYILKHDAALWEEAGEHNRKIYESEFSGSCAP